MSLQNLASGVKEQDNPVSTFSLIYKTKGPGSAWEFYLNLDLDSKTKLRKYRSDNGLIDFPSFLDKVQNKYRPCGIAYKVEKLELMDLVNKELESISKKERKSYLNGNLLTLEI